MSFCQQKTSARFPPLSGPSEGRVEEKDLWKGGGLYAGSVILGSPLLPTFPLRNCAFIWVMAPQEVRSYPLSWLCRKKVNALYFEKFQKSMYRSFNVEIDGCRSQHCKKQEESWTKDGAPDKQPNSYVKGTAETI
ncbi:hypothetical protein GOODEAATRI_034471 [Goodea atripinnis]|uniref:Uncharacterized protein n=1 Tax=Goodea atripinnis TaxID=208336 RepID=A0ABV0PU32_9TELE